ncbi:MAG TPA: Asp-tRNA(Asn)/Glu-tRNA(Gln) amidotransferase subunit GatA [Clostridia bacterium]|nr:Asp-tRNA(Asn)/Glu-tRNA(Gln) amidotransferase subunit GatA [Clostridia bacterium]
MKLNELTAHRLHEMLINREVSARDITEAVFNRIDEVEDELKAYVRTTKDLAYQQAEEVDQKIQRGENIPPLAGIPIALKDNICTKGVHTTCSSKMLENFIPPYDATVVEKIKENSAVIVGKTNMDEFAMGSSTETSAFYPTKNPWDITRVPGGSSGGSAAAVAADETIVALGSDTGGSIRQPAAFCGVVGLKPTYGVVSRYGVVAYASSFDQVGTITKDVTDCALLLNVIAGHDSNDTTSVKREKVDYTKALIDNVKGLKIGVPKEYFAEGLDPEVEKAVLESVEVLKSMGAQCEEVSLPHLKYALPTYCIIAMAEASANMARYDGIRYGYRTPEASDLIELYKKTRSEGFGNEVKRRIMLGTYALSTGHYDAYYLKAQKVRTLIKQDFEEIFKKVDVLLAPVTPDVAFRLGEKVDDPLTMYLTDSLTVPANIAGLPAISIPCGFKEGMPIGLQILAKHFAEATLLQVAYTFERNTDFHRRKPNYKGQEGGKN